MADEKLGPFYGINNRREEYDMGVVGDRGRKAGDFIRNGINIDITGTNKMRRRKGIEKKIAGTDAHSLWSDIGKTFYIDGTTMYALDANMNRTTVRSGLTPGERASYAAMADQIYWSNSIVLERIRNGVSTPVGIPVPNPAPDVAVASGSLPAGLYQIAITAMNEDYEESGSTWPVQILVPENGAIEITGIPVSAYAHNIYISSTNGDVLFYNATLMPGVTNYNLAVFTHGTRQLRTMGLVPMPAGHIVRNHNSTLLVADGSMLRVSEPYAPALHNPAKGYISLPARITIVQPCIGGVFVVADQTYWLAGTDPMKASLLPVLAYGAVEGTGGASPEDKTVFWFSHEGLIVGDQSGAVNNVQEKNVAVEVADHGASLYRIQDGVKHYISSMFGAEVSNAAARSYMEAEIVRKGSML